MQSRSQLRPLERVPYHVTQRGTNRQKVFFSTSHRKLYLNLIAKNQEDAGVRVLGYCMMTNHVHWVVIPEREDSLAVLFRRVHGAYAQAVNAGLGRSGHLWQNRFFSCPVSERHLWIVLKYVEANPVRARLAARAEEYRWSSEPAHIEGVRDQAHILDWEFWERSGGSPTWKELQEAPETDGAVHLLRRCTYAGRPFGEEEFVAEFEAKFQRNWRRWSFEKSLLPRLARFR